MIATKTDRRYKCRPLTAEQQSLVAGCAGWIGPWVQSVIYPFLIRRVGLDECVAEAWLIVTRAASIWAAADGRTTFDSFAMSGVKRFLPTRLMRRLRADRVWAEMPTEPSDGSPMAADLRDHRGDRRDRLLAAWCDPDASRQRRRLDWRCRLVLYLRLVECLTLEEVGAALRITRQRVNHLERRGLDRLASAHARKESRTCS